MRKTSAAILVAMLIIATFGFAQNPPQKPTPPEHKKLEYFAGNWTMEGDMKPSPFGPAGKFTATEHNEWMPGGFFLVSHSDENTPATLTRLLYLQI